MRGFRKEDKLHALRLVAPPTDDATHLARAADGDAASQAWIVNRWTQPLYRFAYRMLGNEQDARDATQDTMVKVLRNLHRYDPNRAFSTWVFGIARNTCIDEHRRRKRRSYESAPDVADQGPTPLQQVTTAERSDALHEALQQIPPMYREVLIMYHFEHLKYAEIADTLDIPLGTVMNRIFRARRKMRDILEPQGGIA